MARGSGVSSRIVDGRTVVTTAGTRVQLSTAAVAGANSTIITGLSSNTNPVVVGGATVVATVLTRRGTPLAAGVSVRFNCDPSLLWLDAVTSGEVATWTTEAG